MKGSATLFERSVMLGRTVAFATISAWIVTINMASSQISSESVEPHIITNARAAALADGITADANDVSGMYWNPALLSFLRQQSVMINYSLERIHGRDNIMNENVVFPLGLQDGWSLGVGITQSHVGHIAAGSALSGYRYHQGSADIAVSKTISVPLSVGVDVAVRYGKGTSDRLIVASSVLGVCYQPSPEISYGLSIHGIGNGIDYTFDEISSSTNPMKVTFERSLELGVTLRLGAMYEPSTAVITTGGQKNFGTKGVIYKGGIEVWATDFLALRTGYWVGTKTVAARYGAGLRVGQWQLDYGASTTALEPIFHQITLSFCFGSHLYHR